MACRSARTNLTAVVANPVQTAAVAETKSAPKNYDFKVGVDTVLQANDLLQNNLIHFDWVAKNKSYPNFWGRYLTGENRLTKEEIKFLHSKGCKIVPIYKDSEPKETEEQGKIHAKKIAIIAMELGITEGTAIFLELPETFKITRDYLKGYALGMFSEGYVPGFKANTDAKYIFDAEYSRGTRSDNELFKKCLIWSVSPNIKQYERTTNSHFIHPDYWGPFAPSGITRDDIAIWQYGIQCHPINDDEGRETSFNVNLVINPKIIIENMF